MAGQKTTDGTAARLDEGDRRVLRELQRDATQPLDRIAAKVGLSKTAVWNRIQRLHQDGVILRQAAIIDAGRIGLAETFFVAIRTSQHNADWLNALHAIVREMPEITEAHRLAGQLDYLLKVQVTSTTAFDAFYKRLVSRIDLYDVTSSLSMEVLKQDHTLPV